MKRAVLMLTLLMLPAPACTAAKRKHVSPEAEAALWDLTSVVEPKADQDLAEAEEFTTWFEREGGEFAEGTELAWSHEYGYHLVARQPIVMYEMVAATPYHLLLRLSMLDESIDNRAEWPQHQQMALLLVRELLKGRKSLWAPWIAMLPHSLPSAMYFTRKDLNILRGTSAHFIMEQVSDKAGEFAERAMDRYGKLTEFAGLNEMKLVWALSMALSRAFAGASEDGKTTLFIAPGCDMLNHDEYGNTTWHYPLSMRKSSSDGSAAAEGSYEDVSETFRLHTSKEYAGQGEQIFNTYKTGLPNYLLLSHFGFVRPDNEYERISMTSLPNEVDGDRALMRTLQGLAQIKNTNNIHMPLAARSSESSGISPGLIKQFRITMMTSQELQLYYDNVQAMGLDEGSDFSTSMGLSFYVNEELDLLVRFELVKHLHDHYSRIVGHGGAKKIRDQLAMTEMQELKESDENLSSLYRIKAALQITLSEITILHNAIAALMHGKLQKDGSITYDHEHYADLIDSTFTSDGLIEQLKYHDPTLPPIKVKTTVQSHSFSIDASGQGDAFEGLGVAGSHIDGVLSYRQTQSGVGGEHTVG